MTMEECCNNGRKGFAESKNERYDFLPFLPVMDSESIRAVLDVKYVTNDESGLKQMGWC